MIGTVACVKCGLEKTFQTEVDMVGWSWNTVSVTHEGRSQSSTAWRCPDHPAQHDPDHEAPPEGW